MKLDQQARAALGLEEIAGLQQLLTEASLADRKVEVLAWCASKRYASISDVEE